MKIIVNYSKFQLSLLVPKDLNNKLTLARVPDRHKTIYWNNNGKIHRCLYASPGHILSMT